MKKILSREQAETIICILAFGWLSLLCMFVKYDFNEVANEVINLLR